MVIYGVTSLTPNPHFSSKTLSFTSKISVQVYSKPILILEDGRIRFTFVDNTVPYPDCLNGSNYPSYTVFAKPMSLPLHVPGPWLTYYGIINDFPRDGPIVVHANASYWERDCPSFMRNGGVPHITGHFRILSHDVGIVVQPLFPSPMSFQIKCPGFIAMYSDVLEPNHQVWISGRILRRVDNILYINTSIIAPCAHIKEKHWNRRL
ncbi:hypothetical protein PGT21_013045 [Puccinia graminis f. sp. tritici]|uniref:Uncharacterized protein n=1 Tax=Puccinia graminis f. sp. tritici TaxID=56615 RepID=A0A5B0Q5P7_PUCGR|nr:hypothetical protein PGT21_013045 [Puccinia graminis f. sp. tritici]